MHYRAVNLLIGTACDMNCPYCLQTGTDIPANRPSDIDAFVEQFKDFLGSSTIHRIVIWGGEPMVYWTKTVKPLLEGLIHAGICPKDKFMITTNGRKMADDYVKFANENPVWTTISAHEWGFTKEQEDRFFKLERFSISSIIHGKHISLFDLRAHFYRLLQSYLRPPRLYAHYVRANDGCAKEFYLTKANVDAFCFHLIKEVLPLALSGDMWARWQLAQLLSERRKELAKGNESKCILSDRLAIDLHGNKYECHHNYDAKNIIGNIFSKAIPIYPEEKHIDPFKYSDSASCRSCHVFNECHGGCYLSNTHEVDCYMAKKLHAVYTILEGYPWTRFTGTPMFGFGKGA